jgi:HEAT repeat protein
MVEVGRLAQTDSSGADTLDALEQGTFYERRLALVSCFGSRDGSRVLRALDDQSRHIRGLARRLVPLACDDQGAIQALGALRTRERCALCKHLYNARRRAPIDAFMAVLAEGRDDELSNLLPYASRPIVEQYLEEAFDRAGPDAWKRLARLYPQVAVARLLERAQQAEGLDKRLVWHVNAVLPVLDHRSPDLGLSLVREMSRTTSLTSLALQGLVDRRPGPTAELLLASGDAMWVSFDRVAHRLSPGLLIELAGRHPALLSRSDFWLQKLPPAARRDVFVALQLGWRDHDGVVGHAILAQLPADIREHEGRRHTDLPLLRTRPSQRLPYASLLRWEEARDILDPFIHNPDADLRSVALRSLIDTGRYHRDRLPEILALIRARRNEQDPVRLAMLTALASLPPSRWRSEHLDDLAAIVSDALAASDLSPSTAHAAERLVVALLPFHSDWSVRWIATLVRERGRVSMYGLEDRLTDDQVRQLAPTLLPVLQAWATREREGQLVGAAQAFGRRLRVFPALVSLLERVMGDTRSAWTANLILSLLRKHRPDRLAAVVPQLVRDDPSAIVLTETSNFLHRRRQDILTPFLGRPPGGRRFSFGRQGIRGRFATGKTHYVPPYSDGFHRWTATQQETFAQTLRELIGDPERDSPSILSAINQLSGLQAVEPTRLIQLADARNPKLAVRDAALWALGRLDSGEGVPALLEATGDDRGRVAIYALRRALLGLPENRALPLLLGVRMEKVTVAKEVVRLIGELRGEAAYRELLSIERDELRRDVRVALLRALWDHLERNETWPVLERAATSPDDAVAEGSSASRPTVSRWRLNGSWLLSSRHRSDIQNLGYGRRCWSGWATCRSSTATEPFCRP